MIDVLTPALTVAALVAAAWSVLLMVLNRPLLPPRPLSAGLGVVILLLELALVTHAVIGITMLVGTSRDVNAFSVVGYLLGPVLVVPAATLWALAERTRWGAGVLLVACLSVPVMLLRLGQVWAGHA